MNLPESLRQEIWHSSSALRDAAPSLRWSRADNLHITLKFLGSQPAERVEQFSLTLAEVAANHSAIRVDMRHFGAFPNPQRPRVVWLGIKQGAEELSKLAHDVDHACGLFGVPLETRPFKAHITLARSKDPLSENQRLALSKTMKHEVNFKTQVIESIDLMRSDTGPGGSRYTVLALARLGGGR